MEGVDHGGKNMCLFRYVYGKGGGYAKAFLRLLRDWMEEKGEASWRWEKQLQAGSEAWTYLVPPTS